MARIGMSEEAVLEMLRKGVRIAHVPASLLRDNGPRGQREFVVGNRVVSEEEGFSANDPWLALLSLKAKGLVEQVREPGGVLVWKLSRT